MTSALSTEICSKEKIEYLLNHTRMKRLKDKILLTTDTGSWVVLDAEQYRKLLRCELDEQTTRLFEQKGIIITAKNIYALVDDFRKRYHFLFRGTGLHIILPTLRCNQKCTYCHSSVKVSTQKEYDMDLQTAQKTLDFIFSGPSDRITIEFQGGETLLNEKTFKFLVTRAKEMNNTHKKDIRFSVVSNLTMMTDEYFNWLVENNVEVCTSLDGPKEVHDKNRILEGGGGSYDQVTAWLQKFRDRGRTVGALQVTTKYSLPRWKEIIDEYLTWGITTIQLKYINKLGFASGPAWENMNYDVNEFIDFWKKSLDYMIQLNKQGIKIRERYVVLILEKILTKHDPSFLDLRSPCGIVIGQLAYDYNGDIYSCDEGRNFEMFKLGNVHTHTYKEILSSEKTQELVKLSMNDNLICDNCAYKPYCGVCIVTNYAATGGIIPKTGTGQDAKCVLHTFMFNYIFEKITFEPDVRDIFFDWMTGWRGNVQS